MEFKYGIESHIFVLSYCFSEQSMDPALKLSDIKALNIEISSQCNARCPFCSRNQKVRPYGAHRISLTDFKHLPKQMLEGLRRITFAGNFGDLATNTEFPDIVAYIRSLNRDIALGGETNGSVQKERWWRSLGQWFDRGTMVFALDGLADTHGLHRIGTDFNGILRNIAAFTSAGGVAHWKFIVFEHNAHQIKQAERLARDIGCARFFAMSSRSYNAVLKKPEGFDVPIKRELFGFYRDVCSEEDACSLCKPFFSGTLYIAADGSVHPCCFAHCMYITENNPLFRFIVPIIEKYHTAINFKTTPLEEIISGSYFREVREKSKRNPYCITKCTPYKKKIRRDLIIHDRVFE